MSVLTRTAHAVSDYLKANDGAYERAVRAHPAPDAKAAGQLLGPEHGRHRA
jgi:hypothetical protein